MQSRITIICGNQRCGGFPAIVRSEVVGTLTLGLIRIKFFVEAIVADISCMTNLSTYLAGGSISSSALTSISTLIASTLSVLISAATLIL